MTTIIGGIVVALKGLTFLGGSLSFVGLAILIGAFVSEKNKKEEETNGEKNSPS